MSFSDARPAHSPTDRVSDRTRPLVRVCFQLRVKPDRLDDYRRRHEAVWPEMLESLSRTGWSNYSLFLAPDGLLIGYFETPSLDEALAGMAATEINGAWQAEMAEFFEDLDGRRPDQGFLVLDEVFNLESQLEGQRQLTGRDTSGPDQKDDTP